MKGPLGRELVLLVLSSAPMLLSFLILSIEADWARRFIEIQLVGTSLSAWLSFGLAPALSAVPLASTLRPPRRLLLIGSCACPFLAVAMWLSGQNDMTDAALIASLNTIAVIYRVPGKRVAGRVVLLTQFLLIEHELGRAIAATLVCAALCHLSCLGAFYHSGVERMRPATVGHAYLVSIAKDFFYRGHYLALSSLGLADQNYAAILRLIDITSRPTDYLFQRLVDENLILSRMWHVLLLLPLSATAVGIMLTVMPSFSWASFQIVILTSFIGSLVTLTKYLAYEQNSRLRFVSMTAVYSISSLVALGLAYLGLFDRTPVLYLFMSLLLLMTVLLTFRSRMVSGAPK